MRYNIQNLLHLELEPVGFFIATKLLTMPCLCVVIREIVLLICSWAQHGVKLS